LTLHVVRSSNRIVLFPFAIRSAKGLHDATAVNRTALVTC
jgi:hypothetical protein